MYAYGDANPVNLSDSQGLWVDAFVDLAFIAYDLFRIGKDNIIGSCDNLGENLAALAADSLAAVIPGLTGSGMAVRSTNAAAKVAHARSAATAAEAAAETEKAIGTSRAARGEAMRQEGIPTSQQPASQTRNASGRSLQYDVPKPGGGTQSKSVQQQTIDRNHPGETAWEAGPVKTDPVSGQTLMNQHGAPKLTNQKSKVIYRE